MSARAWLLLVALLAASVALDRARFAPAALGTTLGLAAPLGLAAIASVPPILAGGGGIDISVGPFMGLVNAFVVQVLVGSWGIQDPLLVIPLVLLLGLASGLVNGLLAVVLRVQPIVATLGTYLVYTGLTLRVAPTPGGTAPEWLADWSSSLSVVPLAGVLAAWWLLTRVPFHEQLLATGGDDRAAYTAGVRVVGIRVTAYVLAGLFAAIGGLSLTALLGSVDPNVGPTYTLNAIAAVALGAVSLAGGRGGMLGALVGAFDIFLIQGVLTYFNVSSFVLQVAYGAILVAAVALGRLGVGGRRPFPPPLRGRVGRGGSWRGR